MIAAGLPVISALGLAQAANQPAGVTGIWFNERGATFSQAQDELFMFIFWLCVFFFVLLMSLSGYFWWRYRRREGVPTLRSPSHNIALELTWTIVPTLLLAVIFVWGFRAYLNLHIAPANAEQIEVSARKWQWSFSYDNGGEPGGDDTDTFAGETIPVIAVPAGRPVKFLMSSEDVIHSCFIPAFRTKLDVMPSRYTTMWFEALPLEEGQEERAHWLFCAEYCGDNHSKMYAKVRVLPEEAYQQWKADIANPWKGKTYVQRGEEIYRVRGCAQCHTTDGSPSTGPTWLNVWGREETLADGSTVTVDENYVRESIYEPGAKIVQGFPNQMVSYQGQLSDRDVRAIIAYMKSLSGEAGQAALTEEETTVQDQ